MSDLEKELKELKEAVKTLLELEKLRIQREVSQPATSSTSQVDVNLEELEEEIRENYNLGELVAFAIKKDLIPRGDKSSS